MPTPTAPVPADEVKRLLALQSLNVLDTGSEPQFDELVAQGRTAFGVETALITLIDSDRQWFKARAGLDMRETERDIAFCAHSIMQAEPFVVLNASRDTRFAQNPLVTGAPRIRFYAGAPLVLPGGEAIGTFCLIDPEPRFRFTPKHAAMLSFFAGVTVERLVARATGQVLASAA